MWEGFPARVTDVPVGKTETSVTQGQPTFSYEHIKKFNKGGQARSWKPSQPGQPGSC